MYVYVLIHVSIHFPASIVLRGHSFLMQIVTHLHPRRDLVGTIRNTHASAEALASPRVDAACPLHK